MTRKLLATAILVATCASASGAFAQTNRGPSAEPTIYNITDADLVSGSTPAPNETLVGGRRSLHRDSLVHPREHFVFEMLKSIENL